jgi:hypothetical protein
MEAVRTSETSVDNHFTRQYNPEDSSEHHTRRRENLKSHTLSHVSLHSTLSTSTNSWIITMASNVCAVLYIVNHSKRCQRNKQKFTLKVLKFKDTKSKNSRPWRLFKMKNNVYQIFQVVYRSQKPTYILY